MEMFSLRTIIDDILLLVRNNNISESEDLSRAQIAAWVMAYKAAIIRQRRDQVGDNDEEESLGDLIDIKGPFELEKVDDLDMESIFRRVTKEEIIGLENKDPNNIISVFDQNGEIIQLMNQRRRFLQMFRKYTGHELTYEYINDHIYITGDCDFKNLKYIWVNGLFTETEEEVDEDDINIPGWMIPDIKQKIMQNELSFMLQRPSDDDDNSTLDGIKPQPGAVTPNEK